MPAPSTDATSRTPPWLQPDFLGHAPQTGYGYVAGRAARSVTLEELREAVGRGAEERIHFVWSPRSDRLVPTAEVPELFESLRVAQVARATEVLRARTPWVALAGVAIYFFGERVLAMPFSWLAMLWAAFLLLPLVTAWITRVEWTRARPEDAPELGETSRFMSWLAWQKTTRTTHLVIAAMVVTWLLSQTFGHSKAIRLFAMDQAGVQAGAWWKLLTCFFLHGGIIHLVFNSTALAQLGRWVESVTEAAWVPLILLLSTLGGSLAGSVLPPDVPSVGASGGVIGLLGFLLVFSRSPRRSLPPGFRRELWQWVGYVFLLGGIGWKVIDNAAHLGGLLTGAALGAIADRLLPDGPPPVRASWVPAVGWSAALVLAVTAGWMIREFLPGLR